MTAEQIVEYTNRLSSKNWAKVDGGKKVEYLLKRISLLKNEEQEKLIFNLTEKFEYISYSELLQELLETFSNCVTYKSQNEEFNVLVAPLKCPFIDLKKYKSTPDGKLLFSKSKSPDMIYPLLKNSITDETIIDMVRFCDDPSIVAKNFISGKCSIVLIDDFVGTGLTAKKHIDAYIDLLGQYSKQSSYADYCVVVDVAMLQGIDYLLSLGIQCYTKRKQSKGISDDASFSEEEIKINVNLMKEIEKSILCNMKRCLSLGFYQSESLVSIMNKAPNNTFPFYWEKCIGDAKPIFRRYYE